MTHQPDRNAQAALVRAAASFVRDTYSGEWADDAATTLETDADLIEHGEPCSLLRLAETMQPAAVSAAVAPPTDDTDPELTTEEARTLADDLGLQLYRAQDALAFVAECCDIADREQRTVTTADVREWLKGARCGRQLAADAADQTAILDLDAIAARAADAQQYGVEDDGFEQLVREDVPALVAEVRRLRADQAADTGGFELRGDTEIRAAVLREAADDLATAFGDPMVKHIGALGASHLRRRAREIEAEPRRMADETATETPAALTEPERKMLAYALDQTQEHIWSRDGFTDEDQAAVDSLRRLTDEPAAGARQDGAES